VRLPLVLTLILIVIGILIDIYVYSCICKRVKVNEKLYKRLHIWSSVVLNIGILVFVSLPRRNGTDIQLLAINWALYTYLSVFIPKLIFFAIDIIASIPRLFGLRRIKAITSIGAISSVIVFIIMWWGALINRYNLDIKGVEVTMPHLPDQFEGYRIIQISDLHLGSFGSDTEFIEKIVSEINSIRPDMIVFTGDLVNRRSSEAKPFVPTLSRLYAKDGVYSILGNHDYGDYADWESPAQKKENLELMKEIQKEMGWHLLLDSTVRIRRGSATLALIGVENIGDPPFTVYGSLERAYPAPRNNDECKILLTHNPAHWANNIADNTDETIDLTLSGHTHAMQLSVCNWSPAMWAYPTWSGLYTDLSKERSLYVNIGLGTVGMPMRIGATPEITVFTLTK